MPDRQVEYVDFPIYHDELAAALEFSPSDLQANQAGRLTDSQRARQFTKFLRAVAISAVCLALAAGCLVLALSTGITTGLGIQILLLGGCFMAFAVLVAWFNIPLWRDLQGGAVSSLEGFVQAGERSTRMRTGPGTGVSIWSFYWVVDNAQRFGVPGKAYSVLTPARHRLYFLPLTRRIVAAEPISSPTS